MITKQQYDEAKKLIEEYENQPKHDFIPGEFVQCRDYEKDKWSTVFVHKGIDSDGWHRCSHIEITSEITWKYIRRPVDVPGIPIRWAGGECPVGDENARAVVMFRNGEIKKGLAKGYTWKHLDLTTDIIAYMILPEGMK